MTDLTTGIITLETNLRALRTLHVKTAPLLKIHKTLTKQMLQWPTPFVMTEARQELIRKQQLCQSTPDQILTELHSILAELSTLSEILLSRG